MHRLIVVMTLLVLAGSASAQPGQTPVYSQPPPYQPYPAYSYQQRPVMQVQLTVDEQWLLQRGFISDGQLYGGGALALFFGYGIGQAVQGRWSQTGYIFTFGDLGSAAVMMYGMIGLLGDCFEGCSEQRENRYVTLMVAGAIAGGIFRIWEIYDAFAAPGEHNRRLLQLRARLGMPTPMYARVRPYVAPSPSGEGGGTAGISLRF